jgi:hypothetical protein
MKRTTLAAAAILLVASACNSKPVWKSYSKGPVTLDFPCEPTESGARVKCMRPDGTEYALAVVDKQIAPEQELKDIAEYASTLAKAEVMEGSKYPLRWREVRQFRKLDSWLYFQGDKEYTITVDYSTETLPETAVEFFSRIKVAQ